MTAQCKPPASHPCGSCPYRRDVPSGVWTEGEYHKLPPYDEETFAQPLGIFLCHQQDGRVCAGWAGCHDMTHTLAVRMSLIAGSLSHDDHDLLLDYATSVPLFSSGQEAAQHGLAEIASPGHKARRTIDKLLKKRGRP